MDDKSPRKIMSMAADPRGQRDGERGRVARDFDQAHRWAFIHDALSLVRYQPADLLPFEVVRDKLHLDNGAYLGLQEIPLTQIVGSLGRYEDFTRTFMPRKTHTRPRWEGVDTLVDKGGWLPIEVYKVSDIYFVRDGNHRVSVARQLGMETLEAHIWEYKTRVPLEPDDDLDDLIIRAEYLGFLEETQLDKLRPDQWIVLTLPGGYWELESCIAIHRHWQSRQYGNEMTWLEAVTDWYDNVYVPMVAHIQQENILSYFPGRTEADLAVWVMRHWDKLEQNYGGEEITSDEVVKDFADRTRSNLPRRLLSWVERTFMGKPVDQE